MAHFYGKVQGSHGEVTRTGTKSSGLKASVNGWNIGGDVEIEHDPAIGDIVNFYITKGSNNPERHLLGTFTLDLHGNIIKGPYSEN